MTMGEDRMEAQSMFSVESRPFDEKVKEQVIRGKAYLTFTPSSDLVKELKIRIERALSLSIKDYRVLEMKAVESTLSKASRLCPDCAAMIKKLRAMAYNAEEQLRLQRTRENFLRALGRRTIPKGLHCLSIRLTAQYFSLEPEKRELPYKHNLQDHRLLHLAVFSDNILASAVVVNSTVSTAQEPWRLVFHIVTDSLNLPAISMWFLLNPPGEATVHVESTEQFQWLTKHKATLEVEDGCDPLYNNFELYYLRFYLPDVFPYLSKIVLLDHDVVVKKDITPLWSINMRGQVNGAAQTCYKGEPSPRRIHFLLNFTDPIVGKKYNAGMCFHAFGVNLFDLQGWRQKSPTILHHVDIPFEWKSYERGRLPIWWITSPLQAISLDRSWHVLGLGHDPGVSQEDIDDDVVIHYDGVLKPWLDIGIEKYKPYWRKHVNYDHPYLQQCNDRA